METIHSYSTHLQTETQILKSNNWQEIIAFFDAKFSSAAWLIDNNLSKNSEIQGLKNTIFIDGGDKSKSMSGVTTILEKLSEFQMDRNSILIAIGGGSISDLGGFIASIYLRGIKLAIIPSTLLSLIDASMGGKNGINFLEKKNQIGTIYQPHFIINYTPIFESLSEAELSDGFAEIIKYGLILDKPLFEAISEHTLVDFRQNEGFRDYIVNSCIIQKSNTVEKDPFESDYRRILNFGHTIGHALESIYAYSHGQAVGLGMIFAVKLSEKYYPELVGFSEKIKSILVQYGLPIKSKYFDKKLVLDKILFDKKRESDFIHFVLISEIGKSIIQPISISELENFLDQAEKEEWI